MNDVKIDTIEQIQRIIAGMVASNPSGRNLLLIGGFRYRFLDHSVRVSDDIDYHWGGDAKNKQQELLKLFERRLLPEVKKRFNLDGQATAHSGPEADSTAVIIIDLAFWGGDSSVGRIEIPVEITRIVCADKLELRTASGVIYPTVSDADMIESKILAVFNRVYLRHRDLLDIYLFKDHLHPDSGTRLAAKISVLQISETDIQKRYADLIQHSDYHARTIQEVINTQIDSTAAEHLQDAGGAAVVLRESLNVIEAVIPTGDYHADD